jgi:hypothetical protein
VGRTRTGSFWEPSMAIRASECLMRGLANRVRRSLR